MLLDSCLVDTNVLLLIPKRSDPYHLAVDRALSRLAIQGITLYYTHQNIAELWNVMARPPARNGFGLSVADANREVRPDRGRNAIAARWPNRISGMAQSRGAIPGFAREILDRRGFERSRHSLAKSF